jgi:galactan endo-1,6-beta-galactosidase
MFFRKQGTAVRAVLFWVCATLMATSARADYTTTINPRTSWGVWEGWGTSLCWWANVFGGRNDLADLFFTTNYTYLNGQTLPGLGMNIARYNAGGCASNSINGEVMQVSPNIPAFRQIRGYWLDWFNTNPASASWDWAADANQRSMLLKAKARGANLFELFSNSPMWWMCYNHNPSGADSGGNDNLQSWNYASHALYLATVAQYASDHWGISFASVEPFNEPNATWWTSTGTQEGCHFARSTQAAVIGYLNSELASRGLGSTVVAASDETSYDDATATWTSFNSLTRSQVGRVNVHGYQYGGGRRDLLYSAVAGKKLWNSEYGESDGAGISLASNLNLDFRWLHMTAWCYWQVLDSGGWGLIQSNPGDNWIGTANPKFFVLAQYTRHIRPGMIIVDGGEGNTVAAFDPVAHKLVIVTMNYASAQTVTYDLSGFFSALGPVRRWLTSTASGPKYASYTDTALANKTFRSSFPINTIQTFEIQNVYLTPSPPPVPSDLAAHPGVGRVRLNWTAAAGAASYNVKRALASGGPFTSIASVTVTNFQDTAVTNETTYFYSVSSDSPGGESANSDEASATPHAPPLLSATLLSGTAAFVLSWPDWAADLGLVAATNLVEPIAWAPVTNGWWLANGTISVTVPTAYGQQFFRLAAP